MYATRDSHDMYVANSFYTSEAIPTILPRMTNPDVWLLTGDALARLRDLPDGSIHLCVTSPPYYGLRNYSAIGQIGHEKTPKEYVANLTNVFREVRRVLRDDGSCWVVIGDCYANGGRTSRDHDKKLAERHNAPRANDPVGVKEKDLIGIPWMLANALREPYHTGPIKKSEDRAWLAAMLDSDGSLGIRVQKYKEGRTKNESFIPYLAISQTDTGALEHCAKITGMGSINIKARPPVDLRGIRSTKTFYTWRLDGQQASKVIRDVYPYLIIKQIQAQIVYAMNLSLKWGRPTRALPVPPDIMDYRRKLYTVVKALNQRDFVDVPVLPIVPPAEETGWYLREEIVWQKPSCLPESVRDRSTRQHETIFHLTKSPRYFHDWFAIAEPAVSDHPSGNGYKREARLSYSDANGARGDDKQWNGMGGLRNARSVWTINPEASRLKQFAMFPTRLASRVIRASTSDGGCCPTCGAQYTREIGAFEADEAWKKASGADAAGGYTGTAVKDYGYAKAQDASATKARILAGMKRKETIGWTKGCACPDNGRPPIPATVLDPFSGAGTSMLSATRLGRCSIGIDLNPDYQDIAGDRITDSAAKCLDGDGKRLPFAAGEVWRA